MVGVHLVAGVIGTVALGFLAKDTGLFYGGDYKQLVVQIVIAAVALAFTAILTAVIAFALKPLGWRVDRKRPTASTTPSTPRRLTTWSEVTGSKLNPHPT